MCYPVAELNADKGVAMTDQSSLVGAWLLGVLSAAWYATNPWAATGAAFGCCFFLAYPGATTTRQRWLLGAFSLGIGYACGVFFYSDNRAMLVSGTIAALASVLFAAWAAVITSNGNLPPWMRSLIELWPFKRGTSRDDPQ